MSRKKAASKRQPKKDVRVWYVVFFALGGVVALFIGFPAWPRRAQSNKPAGAYVISITGSNSQGVVSPKGPWGVLSYEKLPLENFDQRFPNGPSRLSAPRWVFENLSPQQLNQTLLSCDLTAGEKSFLLDTNRWEPLTNGFAISPTPELVLGLGKNARQLLYPILARSAANSAQFQPFRAAPDKFDDQFADSGIAREKLDKLRELTYEDQGALCLCVDAPVQNLFSTNEFESLLKALYTVPSWSVRVQVTPDSDVDGLVKYWGRGGREKTIRPLVESLAHTRRGGFLNISAFLPGFARMRLYTFPDPATDLDAGRENCLYTAMNFFNTQPDPQLSGGQYAKNALLNDYSAVPDKLTFGDVMVLFDSKGTVVHACVYIADDIVFTKNGMDAMQPWVLMKFPDMMTLFPADPPLRTKNLRRKTI
ncbi:MAG: hypothetical protein JWR26_1618 [Pedosphaera sp.]|nr:hypothetical protein [Pedosphaera sp.]